LGGACVSIVAIRIVASEDASLFSVTAIVGAGIGVIAYKGSGRDARTLIADIAYRALVAIAARKCVVSMSASSVDFTAICGAGVSVVTIEGSHSLACTVHARVVFGAVVPIVAVAHVG
jgi:hypothetical protein